jgi:hypothetical protein
MPSCSCLLARLSGARLFSSLALVLLGSVAAMAQARIVLTTHGVTNTQTEIHPRIENTGDKPVTYCVDISHASLLRPGSSYESTPIPFVVEKDSETGWRPLMVGTETGNVRRPVVLQPGKSDEYPFALAIIGRARLVLPYWLGAQPDLDCTHPPKGARKTHSKAKVVVPAPGSMVEH